jgi:hypothetical protein
MTTAMKLPANMTGGTYITATRKAAAEAIALLSSAFDAISGYLTKTNGETIASLISTIQTASLFILTLLSTVEWERMCQEIGGRSGMVGYSISHQFADPLDMQVFISAGHSTGNAQAA